MAHRFHRTLVLILVVVDNGLVLFKEDNGKEGKSVLILVVVDNGLVPNAWHSCKQGGSVLILVVVDNGLVPIIKDC